MALKPVEIAIRAKDQTKAGINSATSGLERFAAAQARTNARRVQVGVMRQDALELATAYRAAADRANELGQKIAAAKRPSKALREEFAATRVEARRLREEATQSLATVGRASGMVGQKGSFEQFDRIATGANRAKVAVQGETVALNANTAALTRNAAASGRKAKGDLASQITGAAATRNQRGPLGLRPYELQNLSYQVNDFFTQIASGTPITQAFAQQFGQVAQLFPAAISGFVRFIPIIGLATLALAPFVAKLIETRREAENLKSVEQLLRRSGEAASYTAPQLKQLVSALDEYGASAEEARKIVAALVDNSVAPEYLERFGRTAVDTAKALGIDLTEATQKVTTAFTGNADAILALDDEINFLTDSERAHIEQLKKSKKDVEARTYAFGIYERQMEDVSRKQTGPWSQSLKSFNASWEAFINFVNQGNLFENTIKEIEFLLGLINRLANALPGATNKSIGAINQRMGVIDAELERRRRGQVFLRSYGESDEQLRGERLLLQGRRDILTANANGGLLGRGPDGADTTLDAPPTAVQDRASRGGGGVSDAERKAKAQAEFVQGLKEENAEREFQATLVTQSERQQAIAIALRQAENGAREVGLELTAQQREDIVRTVGGLNDEAAAKQTLALIDAVRLDLAKERGEVETEGAYVNRLLQENGLIQTRIGLEGELVVFRRDGAAEYEELIRQQFRLNAAKAAEAAEVAKVTALEQSRADLMGEIAFYEENGQYAQADALRERLAGVNQELLTAIPQLIMMWTVIGGPEADAAILKLQNLEFSVRNAGQTALVSGKQINDMLAQGATGAIDQFAQAIANGENLIGSLRDAFLQFAADFLRQIAQMILQQVILNALQAAGGGGGGAGGGISGIIGQLFGTATVKHEGGIAGPGGRTRAVSIGTMAGALRYHSGGIAGMRPDEVSAILKRGEEVLTEEDPRHRNNLGQGGAAPVSLKNLNIFDPADLLRYALADEAGQKVMLNFVTENARQFQAASNG